MTRAFSPHTYVSTGSQRASTPTPKPISETLSHHESAGLTTVVPWSRGYHWLPLIHHLSTVLATRIILNGMELASATTTAMATAAATQRAYANTSGRAGTLPRIVLMRVPRLTDHAPCGAILLPGPTATDAHSSLTFNVRPVRGLATLPNIATCSQWRYVLKGT
jgi:hypothetical protein